LRQIPNLLTLLRIALSPVIAWLILQARFREALGLVVLAGLTDWFDGYAARLLRVSGKLGVILDPSADKVLLVTLFVTLTAAGLIKSWLLCLVLGRDLVIVIGALLLRIYRNARRFVPTVLGKVSTFFQIVFVLMVLLDAAFPHPVVGALRITALFLTVLFTVLSGIGYVRIGIRMARRGPDSSGSQFSD